MGAELHGRYVRSRDRDRALMRTVTGGRPDGEGTTRFIDDVLYPATKHDATVFRAVTRWELQLDPVDALDANVAVLRAAEAVADDGADDDNFPSHQELVAAVREARR